MAKKAAEEANSFRARLKVEPPFKLPPGESFRPALRSSPPEAVETQRRQLQVLRRIEETWPKAISARFDEGRRLFDRDLALEAGYVQPSWLKQAIELAVRPRPAAAPPPPPPEPQSNDEPQADKRRSRRRDRYAGAKSKGALAVLDRMYGDSVYPTREEVSDVTLCELFDREWDRIEGAKGLSRNSRPSGSTVLRIVGRKD